MLKVLKNLKKTSWQVLIIIILLCVQATTDLALPDYTSKIVNIGIQANGIEIPVPEVVSKNNMEKILMFSNQDNEILENYKLVNQNNKDQHDKNILKGYLGTDNIEGKEIYVLKKMEKEQKEEFSNKLSIPLVGMLTVENPEISERVKTGILEKMPEEQKMAMQNMETFEIINLLPLEAKENILDNIISEIEKVSESIREQASISSIKGIYKEAGVDTDKVQNGYILQSGLQMLGVASITMVSAVLIMLFSSRVAAKLGETLREKIFSKVLTFTRKELNEFSTASLITRTTNDVQQIQQLITLLFRVVVYAPIMGFGGFIKVLNNTNNSLAWIIGLALFAILLLVTTLFIITMPKFKKLQELTDKLNNVAREILTGLPVIRAFNNEKKEEKRFDGANTKLMKTNVFVNRAMSLMMPLIMLIMNIMMILVIWFGGHGIEKGLLQVGDMMAFIQYMMQIVMAFLMISMVSIMLPRASVSARRINEVLETKTSVNDKEKTKKFDEDKKGLVEFKNVCFKYPDADVEVLEDITFTANPGETTAIIGSTGSGKSTIVNLLPRFYDVTGGEIFVDGINIKDASQKDLRNRLGVVPQKGILFSGTVESNIKFADENMTDEDMKEAAKIAQATEFIESKENKYQEPIAQGGNNVSGGQKQRLAIARAIAKDPEIFIFDDSFSALDFKTDAKLREALKTKTKNKTVIIVAQRISTILNADKILVLEEGKIVGEGTHEELLENNETYRQIALSQLSEKELQKNKEAKSGKGEM